MTSHNLIPMGSDTTSSLRKTNLLDAVVLMGFGIVTVATYFSTTIVLPISFLVAFPAYAVRYVPVIPFDGPDRTVFVAYFLAIGVLIAH